MQKFFKLISLSLFISCSGAIKKNNSSQEKFSQKIIVQPGEVAQVPLPFFFKGEEIICSNGVYPVSSGAKSRFFIYAESYFSDMKDKGCKADNIHIHISVDEKVFPFEELKVDRKRVSLNKKDLARVLRERSVAWNFGI